MSLNREDVLEALGLSARGGEWFGPALIGFGIGALIGATMALMLAPRTGADLREDLLARGRRFVQRGREQVAQTAEEVSRSTEPRNY